jgi:hypothetical protein
VRPGADETVAGALFRAEKEVTMSTHSRSCMIEPVFGHTKFNRRIDRFQRRGRSAARSEWRLITATHNLQKLHSHQQALATA